MDAVLPAARSRTVGRCRLAWCLTITGCLPLHMFVGIISMLVVSVGRAVAVVVLRHYRQGGYWSLCLRSRSAWPMPSTAAAAVSVICSSNFACRHSWFGSTWIFVGLWRSCSPCIICCCCCGVTRCSQIIAALPAFYILPQGILRPAIVIAAIGGDAIVVAVVTQLFFIVVL